MKANVVFQPWASLIIMGAKPDEFRERSFLEYRHAPKVGERIVIHAAARPIRPREVEDLLARLRAGDSSVDPKAGIPLCERLLAAHKCQGILPMGCGIGSAVLGQPHEVKSTFKLPDSDRLLHHVWAWPMLKIHPWIPPIEARGMQGFYNWIGETGEPPAVPSDIFMAG